MFMPGSRGQLYLFGYKFTRHILFLSLEIEGKMDIFGYF